MEKSKTSININALAIGVVLGVAIGIALNNVAIGAGVGVAFGAAFDLLGLKNKFNNKDK